MNTIAIRWVLAILSSLWAGIHLVLTHAVLPNPTATMIYETFFGFTASLAILASALLILGMRYTYPLITAFYVIDFALLAESRLFPAPFVGKVLPFNGYVDASLILDVILAASTLVIWFLEKDVQISKENVKEMKQK
ncbi:hypothetical protein [Sulfuracidifex tepidarius]|uniref:Uncharacterized protein n=1 Tax=Sulfuracidifex tepidarius TaxID=1294262 RepID=A0A510E4X5_9CREN|nr:hypothetical protein [Sulfuracidifex tepidarius]BBG24775.1 hypothetical protein IC006_2109 [Sulfuracidifex tepidarius]BBG27561.1 hypothetical protein IC007_2115 [Sulfuracidifex tepidarius]